jgi:hypothetical protein
MLAANVLATCSSLVLVLQGAGVLFVGVEGYCVVSIMALMKELTGIVAVAVETDGAEEGIVCKGDCDTGLGFTC